MMHLHFLLEFSRRHCITICVALVPLNLLATLLTLGLVGLNRSQVWVRWSTAIASLFAGVMVLHVMTWFVIGVVRVPTYVLLLLASVCLLINLWATLHATSLRGLLMIGGQRLGQILNRLGVRLSLLPKTAIQ